MYQHRTQVVHPIVVLNRAVKWLPCVEGEINYIICRRVWRCLQKEPPFSFKINMENMMLEMFSYSKIFKDVLPETSMNLLYCRFSRHSEQWWVEPQWKISLRVSWKSHWHLADVKSDLLAKLFWKEQYTTTIQHHVLTYFRTDQTLKGHLTRVWTPRQPRHMNSGAFSEAPKGSLSASPAKHSFVHDRFLRPMAAIGCAAARKCEVMRLMRRDWVENLWVETGKALGKALAKRARWAQWLGVWALHRFAGAFPEIASGVCLSLKVGQFWKPHSKKCARTTFFGILDQIVVTPPSKFTQPADGKVGLKLDLHEAIRGIQGDPLHDTSFLSCQMATSPNIMAVYGSHVVRAADTVCNTLADTTSNDSAHSDCQHCSIFASRKSILTFHIIENLAWQIPKEWPVGYGNLVRIGRWSWTSWT